MKTMSKLVLALGVSLACAGVAQADQAKPAAADAATVAQLDHALAGDWRPAADKARDVYRHPRQTLEFFGLRQNDTVIELVPGSGWYSEILAPLLEGHGHYIAAIFKPKQTTGENSANKNGLYKKFADDPAHYGKAQIVEFDAAAPVFGAPASADAVLTFRNVHNWTDAGNAPAMFQAMYAVLKPGGTLGVVDHRAKAGTTLEQNKSTGYLPVDAVVKLATDAGFKLVAQSEINANPKDGKDWPKGVWTLPPTFALKDVDRDKYAAIGESDRMTLKFVKPAK